MSTRLTWDRWNVSWREVRGNLMEINCRPWFPLILFTSNQSANDAHPHQSAAPPLVLSWWPTPHLTHPTTSSIHHHLCHLFLFLSLLPLSFYWSTFLSHCLLIPFLFGHLILSRTDSLPWSSILCLPFGYIILSQPTLCSIFIFSSLSSQVIRHICVTPFSQYIYPSR
jgi:hypothetical protein